MASVGADDWRWLFPATLDHEEIQDKGKLAAQGTSESCCDSPEGISSQLSNRMRRCASLEGGTSKE